MWNKISKVVFLSCALAIGSGVSRAQTNDALDSKLNKINLALKGAWKEPSKRELLKSSTEEIWGVLDTALVDYLNSRHDFQANETNQDFKTMLDSTLPFQKRGWTAAIETYSVGDPRLCLAVYDDFYEMGFGMFTLRILGRKETRWKVVARMQDSDTLKELYSAHQTEMGEALKRMEGVRGETVSYQRRVQELLMQRSISDMGITISSSSIHSLPAGGFEFVTILTAVSTVAAESVVKWDWTPGRGLNVISWVWADEWLYDPVTNESSAKWHTRLEKKNVESIKLKDFR